MGKGEYKIGRVAYMKAYRAKHKERLADGTKKWRAQNKDSARKHVACSVYGLTHDQYDALMAVKQCDICGDPPSGKSTRLSIDHDHDTGEIRGMLCRLCNSALGLARENPAILRAMVTYLEKRNAKVS